MERAEMPGSVAPRKFIVLMCYPCPDGKLKLARRASPEAGQRWVMVLRLV